MQKGKETREPSNRTVTYNIPIPTGAAVTGAAFYPLGTMTQSVDLVAAVGHLESLTSGTFSLSLRDMKDDTEFGRIQWTAAGNMEATSPSGDAILYTLSGSWSGVKVNVVSAGVGALGCSITLTGRFKSGT